MALPKDPRQKMINFMYLVLTAMLALNVSAEILNAFDIVNNSITTSNTSIDSKNKVTYNQFDELVKTDAAKVGPFKAKAEEVKKLSADAHTYIENLKKEIITASDGLNEKGEMKGKDNLDAATRIMENQKKGPALQQQLQGLRTKMLALIDPKDRKAFEQNLPLKVDDPEQKGPVKKSWTTYHFNMVPSIAAITLLSKFQNDVKNSEAMIIDKLLSEVSEKDFKFDQLDAFVSLNSKNFTAGQTLEATVVMGAYSSTVNPTIVINGQPVTAQAGKGVYTTQVGAIGEHSISGTVQLTKPNGEVITRPFTETYKVGASATSISADKMNVIYAALQNPVSITAAGVPAEKIVASVSGGGAQITKRGPGEFVVTASQPGTKAVITVSAEIDGKMKTLDSKEFRVKMVPDPTMKVGVSKGPLMKVADFKAQQGLRADLEDFVFDGVRYAVVGYRMSIDSRSREYAEGEATSEYWPKNAEIVNSLRQLKAGDMVYFENIRVKGPDNKVRSMQNINFKIN
ncbi:gliding motility protein GldM [Chitinophaga barathri]|uniref:Gliding motility protein GldM n=1 Tax=Chitinophaga barathri TaxID=1647451 RepID=A0A3N4M946_9BACT|nr:gliding motility protein GldM [Chitinophaga barathri]RPD40192.1 gliding motility protein GldM [Chitinophaga barathri]